MAANAHSFGPGSTVRITKGTFSGFEGRLQEIDEASHKARVVIDMFGIQTPVEVPADDLELVEKPEETAPTGSAAEAAAIRLQSQLWSWVQRQRRSAWRPGVVEGDSGPTASKFAGIPRLKEGEPWPTCGACSARMPLLVQLNLSELPTRQFGQGLLQLFYCTNAEACRHDGRPFAPWQLVRVLEPEYLERKPEAAELPQPAASRAPGAEPPDDLLSFSDVDMFVGSPQTITRWECVDDFPSRPDMRDLGLIHELLPKETGDVYRIELEAEGLSGELKADDFDLLAETLEGDKLAGWPCWKQPRQDPYPACPECGEPMRRLVFQLESGEHLPEIFRHAEKPRGYILQCRTHKSIVTFRCDSG